MIDLDKFSPFGKPRPKLWRLRVFEVVIGLSFFILALRIYTIQMIDHQEHVAQADENRLDTVSIPATRGIIIDRNGVQLAINVASANVVVTPAFLPDTDSDEERAVLERLSRLIDIYQSFDDARDDLEFFRIPRNIGFGLALLDAAIATTAFIYGNKAVKIIVGGLFTIGFCADFGLGMAFHIEVIRTRKNMQNLIQERIRFEQE